MTAPQLACPRCGVLGTYSKGVTQEQLGPCYRCQPVVMREEIARATASDLIDALITSAIEHHEGPSWHSIPPDRLAAIRDELDARLPPRS